MRHIRKPCILKENELGNPLTERALSKKREEISKREKRKNKFSNAT
jgi:hypothetical protein